MGTETKITWNEMHNLDIPGTEHLDPMEWTMTVCRGTQSMVDELVPDLLEAEQPKRCLRIKDLSERIDISRYLLPFHCPQCDAFILPRACPVCGTEGHQIDRLDWLIISGGDQPCDIAHVRDLIRQCREAGVPVHPYHDGTVVVHEPLRLTDPSGAEPSEWPSDLRVREIPQ